MTVEDNTRRNTLVAKLYAELAAADQELYTVLSKLRQAEDSERKAWNIVNTLMNA